MLRIPAIQGIIDRRILVNFRVDPEVLARELPPPFKPKLEQASNFFEAGSLGYSARKERSGEHEGLELRTLNWAVEPLSVESV